MRLENRKLTYRRQLLTRIWAILLLILFSGGLLVEALHYHEQDSPAGIKSKTEQVSAGTKVSAAKIDCKLCELIKHQSHSYSLPEAVSSAVAIKVYQKSTFNYISGHSIAYILSAANKGPPSHIG